MKKLYTATLLSVVFLTSNAQNVNYTSEIVEFYMTGCDDGAGSDEEPTWKVYTRDNISTIWQGGICHFTDGNIPIVYIPGSSTVIATETNSSATLVDVRFEAWEDDCDGGSGSDRCNYDASCLLGTAQDDCLEFHDPLAGAFGAFPSIPFRNDPQCTWNEYTFNVGDFGVKIRIKWEYTNFTAGSNIDTCATSLALNAEGSGQWSISSGSGGTFSDQFDPNATFLGTSGQTYVLDWNTVPGCATPGTDNITVNIFANPDPQLMADQNPVCEGEDITFSAQDGINYDFAINTTSNIVQSSGADAYLHTGITATDTLALVTVTNSSGCALTDSLTLDVQVAPIPTITRTGSDLSTGSYLFYQWFYNGVPISGATSANYTATANGAYTVQVIGANGCIGESTPLIISNVGIEELGNYFFNAFPNPVNTLLKFQTNLTSFQVELNNLIGQTLLIESNPRTMNVSSLPAGIYLLTVKSQGKKSTRKIIIE